MTSDKSKPVIIQLIRVLNNQLGAEKVAYNLEKQFLAKGYDVKTITAKSLGWPVSVHNKPFYLRKFLLFFEVTYFLFASLIYWLMHRSKNTVFISHNDSLVGDVYINHGLHKRMWRLRNDRWSMLVRNPLHIFLLIREWLRHRLRCNPVIVSFSDTDAIQLKEEYRHFRSRIVKIPNGYDEEVYGALSSSSLPTEVYELVKQGAKIILFVGNEYKRKGLRYVIESLVELSDDYVLVVLGSDSLNEQALKKQYSEHIKTSRLLFMGFQPNVEAFYQAAHSLVLPTEYETWALVGIEALACGLPVLITPVNGVNEYLHDAQNGFYIKQNAQDIAQKIQLIDEMPREPLKEICQVSVKQYSWSSVADRYLTLITEIYDRKVGSVS